MTGLKYYLLLTIISLTLTIFAIGVSKFITGTNYPLDIYGIMFLFNMSTLLFITREW